MKRSDSVAIKVKDESDYLDLATLVSGKPGAGPASAGLEIAGLKADLGVDVDKVEKLRDEGIDIAGAAGIDGVGLGRGSHGAHGCDDEEGGEDGLEELHFEVCVWRKWFRQGE